MVSCTALVSPEGGAPEGAQRAFEDGTPEAVGVLAFLNSGSATLEVLDLHVGLDRRAAEGIVAHRDGADAALGTEDDDRFVTVDELDAIPFVAEEALADLLGYAASTGWVDAEIAGTWDGVTLSPAEVEAVLGTANGEEPELLDRKARLDSRAVDAIVGARPVGSMDALAELSYVGGEAISALLHWSLVHEDACGLYPDFWDLYYGEWQQRQVELGTYELCLDADEQGVCPYTAEARTELVRAAGPHLREQLWAIARSGEP